MGEEKKAATSLYEGRPDPHKMIFGSVNEGTFYQSK
jgi:hypothetical protein